MPTQTTLTSRLQAGGGCVAISVHGDRAVFSELSSTYPLKLLSPYIQDTTALVYLLTYGGGLVSGDELDLKVAIELGATLVLLSQGTTKVFKARPGRRLACVKPVTSSGLAPSSKDLSSTRQSLNFHIAAKGLLLLLPEPVTCFRGALYNQYQRFHIQDNGSVVILDWITSGRMSMGEDWAFSHYYSVNEIFHNGRRIAKDVMLLDTKDLNLKIPDRPLNDRLQPYSCYAMLILYGPQIQSVIAEITLKYNQLSVFKSKTPAPLIWSLSPIDPTNLGVVIRIGGRETEMVKEWLKDALSGLKRIVGLDVYRRAFP
ncbi:UreD-domain-containing protein [Pholiota conissans]|uniref:UreD-domain-containing protein n=1 Tax=Pholiota conissans TaxID=109636 RepID=A0A9P5YRF2_9AGAR|nr:UreD-domain-containing protein [Pholiota conissans]